MHHQPCSFHLLKCLIVAAMFLWIRLTNCETCGTNGARSNLREDFGEKGLATCEGKTCYEIMSDATEVALYASGCGECPKWKVKADCKKCNTLRCNVAHYMTIRENGILCYLADDEIKVGKKQVWCSKKIKYCYLKHYVNRYKEVRFFAGCGRGWPQVKRCEGSLCNDPSKFKEIVEKVEAHRKEAAEQETGQGQTSGGQTSGGQTSGGRTSRGRKRGKEGDNAAGDKSENADYDYDNGSDYDDEKDDSGDSKGGNAKGPRGRRRRRRRHPEGGDSAADQGGKAKDADSDSGWRLCPAPAAAALILAAGALTAMATGLSEPAC